MPESSTDVILQKKTADGWDKYLFKTVGDIVSIGTQLSAGENTVGKIATGETVSDTEVVSDVIEKMVSAAEEYVMPEATLFFLYDDNTVQLVSDIDKIYAALPDSDVSMTLYLHYRKNSGASDKPSATNILLNGVPFEGTKSESPVDEEKLRAIKAALTEENYGASLGYMTELVNDFSTASDSIISITTRMAMTAGTAQDQSEHVQYFTASCVHEKGEAKTSGVRLLPILWNLNFIDADGGGSDVNLFDNCDITLIDFSKGVYCTAPKGTKIVKFSIWDDVVKYLEICDESNSPLKIVAEHSEPEPKMGSYSIELPSPLEVDTVFFLKATLHTDRLNLYKQWL